jgi:hypothetical protein
VLPHGSYSGPLGTFPDAVTLTGNRGSLLRDELTFVRGVGLAKTFTNMISGSSGGFSSSMDLVEVRLAGGIHLSVPAPRLSLATENTKLDVTGRQVTNCAVPCYFVACGLVPGADPPGTYKPCAQTRVDAAAGADFMTQLELLNAAGDVVFRAAPSLAPAGEILRYVQIPLYSAPNEPLPTGLYRLMGKILSDDKEAASAVLTIEIR